MARLTLSAKSLVCEMGLVEVGMVHNCNYMDENFESSLTNAGRERKIAMIMSMKYDRNNR